MLRHRLFAAVILIACAWSCAPPSVAPAGAHDASLSAGAARRVAQDLPDGSLLAVPSGPRSTAACDQFVWTIDVSTWQGNIDWAAVRARGVAGAWIKVSGSDGGNYRDGRATVNLVNATAAGIPWGTYHFASPHPGDAIAQAQWAVAQGYGKGTLWPALDMESNPAGMSGPALDQWALDFNGEVARLTGRRSIIYVGAYFAGFGTNPALTQYPLWIPNYGNNVAWSNPCQRSSPPVPNVWGPVGWSSWQHNSTTRIPGIPANSVDMNITTPELWAQMTGAGVEPNPAPTDDPAAAEQVVWGPGSRGPKVAQIQRIVGAAPDGMYGPQTKAYVTRWQNFLGVYPDDGIWGPDTETATKRLFDALASSTPPGRPTVGYGTRSQDVCDAQALLNDNGYELDIDCAFGPATNHVLVDWQDRNGIPHGYPITSIDAPTWHTLGQAA